MGRGRRIQLAGGIYHLITRSADGGMLAHDDDDRDRRVAIIRDACQEFDWSILTYTLMGTHEHALVLTRDANLSRGLHWLNGVYASRSNRLNGLVGSRIRDHSRAILVGGRSHLLTASIYVHLNPVRAGLVESAEAWPWSTARAMLDPSVAWRGADPDRILRMVSPHLDEARDLYRERLESKVELERPEPWNAAYRGMVMGSPGFVRAIARRSGLPPPCSIDEAVEWVSRRIVEADIRRPDRGPLQAADLRGITATVVSDLPDVDGRVLATLLGYRSPSSVSRARQRVAATPWLTAIAKDLAEQWRLALARGRIQSSVPDTSN